MQVTMLGIDLAKNVFGLHGCDAQGVGRLRRALPTILEDGENGLSAVMRELLGEIGERLRFIDDRLHQYGLTIQRLLRQDERCQPVAANVAAVALANNNAPVLWTLLNRNQSYQPALFPARVPQSG